MNKQNRPGRLERFLSDRGRYRTLRVWGYYLLALIAWVTIVLAVTVVGFLVCNAITWYETDPLYQLLNWVRDYYFFIFILVVLLGWVVISYHFISQPTRQLDLLIQASGQLSQPTEEPIRLPPRHEERGGPVESGPGGGPPCPADCPGGGATEKRSGGLSGPRPENTPHQRHRLSDPPAGRAPDLPGAAGTVHRHCSGQSRAAGGPDQRIFRHHPLQP